MPPPPTAPASAFDASPAQPPGGDEEGRRSTSTSSAAIRSGFVGRVRTVVGFLLCCDGDAVLRTSAARPWSAASGSRGGTLPVSSEQRGVDGKPPGVRGWTGGRTGTGALNSTDPETTTEVVWLMSFPNSGTSYTLRNTERLSQRNTATNYAEGLAHCVPVRPDLADDGPFLHDPGLPPPANNKVLTKTHCGGYCTDCAPQAYVHTIDTFEVACRSGKARDDGGQTRTTLYSPGVPSAAVHLVRNPFDNLVARMHLAVKKAARSRGIDPGSVAVPSPVAMVAWCRVMDARYPTLERSAHLMLSDVQLAWKGLPCWSEWFRYVQWHNRALEVTARFQTQRPDGFPVHLLYYEDYSTNYNATVDALFSFLDLEFRGSPDPFIPGKSYHNYFSVHDRKRAAQFVKAMASPDCWATVKHYFDGMLG